LAEAIRRGCKIRPKKVKKYYTRGKDGACALGAAICGMGEKLPKSYVHDAIYRVLPELNKLVSGCGLDIGWTIIRLNEDTKHSREEIADWLCVEGGCHHPLIGQWLSK
jgi:hypothetical protein